MFEIKGKDFLLNGKKIKIYSGAIHYFRVLPEYWEDRLLKLKQAGFNTVETYVAWNLHEPNKGKYCFDGGLDIAKFLKLAQKVGLLAIVRPGPYICAECDFGGLPAWLLKDKEMEIRCAYPKYLENVKEYFNKLLPILAPLQLDCGGNIIAMQIENEYGSYGNDKNYLTYLKNLYIENKINVLFFTSDGAEYTMLNAGTLPEVYVTLNFGSNAKKAFKYVEERNKPKMCTEFWCGWYGSWGCKKTTRDADEVIKEVEELINEDANFNMYMFCGGTNFGFNAGANQFDEDYLSTITSYDYYAPLTESGDYTPVYHKLRALLHKIQNLELKPLIAPPEYQNIGEVKLTEYADLFDNLENIGEKHSSVLPESMEYYGQNHGLIYYENTILGKNEKSFLTLKDVHDIAYVYVDGEKKATYSRMKKGKFENMYDSKPLEVPAFEKSCKIGVLVDALGRVEYGDYMMDRKGISGIKYASQWLMNIDAYCLPLDNLDKLKYKDNYKSAPLFLKGKFKATSQKDCFVILDGFTKGCVFINGFNLGRYWSVGAQYDLYLPGSLLKDENEIIVFEEENFEAPNIRISNERKY